MLLDLEQKGRFFVGSRLICCWCLSCWIIDTDGYIIFGWKYELNSLIFFYTGEFILFQELGLPVKSAVEWFTLTCLSLVCCSVPFANSYFCNNVSHCIVLQCLCDSSGKTNRLCTYNENHADLQIYFYTYWLIVLLFEEWWATSDIVCIYRCSSLGLLDGISSV